MGVSLLGFKTHSEREVRVLRLEGSTWHVIVISSILKKFTEQFFKGDQKAPTRI